LLAQKPRRFRSGSRVSTLNHRACTHNSIERYTDENLIKENSSQYEKPVTNNICLRVLLPWREHSQSRHYQTTHAHPIDRNDLHPCRVVNFTPGKKENIGKVSDFRKWFLSNDSLIWVGYGDPVWKNGSIIESGIQYEVE
jgi:hypothetical protein